MRHQRLVAVAELQHQIVGDLAGAAGGGFRDAATQRLGAVVQQPLQLSDEAGERRGRAGEQQRRDVVIVQHQAFVGAHLGDAGEADRGVALAALVLGRIAQPQLADRHRGGTLVAGIGVDRLVLADGEPGDGLLLVGGGGFHAAGLAGRQQQVDDIVAGGFRDVERARVVDVVGHAERGAVGQHAGGGAHREFSQRDQVGVEVELGQPPTERAEGRGADAHQAFEVAVVLLQVLRLEEQTLGPDDLVLPAHDQDAGLRAAAGSVLTTIPLAVACTLMLVVLFGATSTTARQVTVWKPR